MEQRRVGNIVITDDGLLELDGTHIVRRVSRADFRGGDIVVGRICKHPYLLTLISLALIALGSYTTKGVIVWVQYGGRHYASLIMMILLIPGGVWLLWEAWRRSPMILANTVNGTVSFEFKGQASEQDLTALQQAARERGFELRRRG